MPLPVMASVNVGVGIAWNADQGNEQRRQKNQGEEHDEDDCVSGVCCFLVAQLSFSDGSDASEGQPQFGSKKPDCDEYGDRNGNEDEACENYCSIIKCRVCDVSKCSSCFG